MKHLNDIFDKPFQNLSMDEKKIIVDETARRMLIEHRKNDRGGIYARTQTEMAYNSNRIEGSTLTKDQTVSLFDTGLLRADGETVYRAKDIEEMTGHFAMFNRMLHTYMEPLSEDLIKDYHKHLNRKNFVADIETAEPENVESYMRALLGQYNGRDHYELSDLAQFHADYEKIHPFQDGNGRTGRMILFKECLRHGIIPVIIEDRDKDMYRLALHDAQTTGDISALVRYCELKQEMYYEQAKFFLYEYTGKTQHSEHAASQGDLDTFLRKG